VLTRGRGKTRRDGCPPIDDSSVSKLLKAVVPEGTSPGGEPRRRGGAAEGRARRRGRAAERRPRRRGGASAAAPVSRSMQRRRRCRGMQRPDSRDDSRDVTFLFACYATKLQIKYCSKHNHMQSSGVVVSIFTAWPQVAGLTPRPCAQGGFFFILLALRKCRC